MRKKILALIVAVIFICGIAVVSFAAEAIDVGNKICAVSGEEIKNETKATYEYQGKIYNFCCPACVEDFKEDPEKYINKIEEELQSEQKEESGRGEHDMEMMEKSEGMHQGMDGGHQ